MYQFNVKKVFVIASIVVLLLLALELINGIVSQRSHYQQQAEDSIAQGWSGKQKVAGPVLILPYRLNEKKIVWDKVIGKNIETWSNSEHIHFLKPDELAVQTQVNTQLRYKSLYKVPIFTSKLELQGKFVLDEKLQAIENRDDFVSWGSPYLSFIITDDRGISTKPVLTWKQSQTALASGSRFRGWEQGLHAELPAFDTETNFDFSIQFELKGMESFGLVPIGENTRIEAKSNWQHPGFNGHYIPDNHQINTGGFSAEWNISNFSGALKKQLEQCYLKNCTELFNNSVDFTLVQPINIYQQSTRAIKYGILFITLTYVAFLAFEALKNIPVHPIQYSFVGAALALFFLLLIAFSEHMAFHWAYISASLAIIALLTVYLWAILVSKTTTIIFSLMTTVLYGTLYVIISSEDSALLMGSSLLFIALTTLMMVTRNINWYALKANDTTEHEKRNL